MSSAIACTSLSLWEMKTMDRPPERRSRMIRNRSSVSPGVSTAVGSSRMSTLAWRISALMISTRCCTPTGRSSTRASGLTCSPYRSDSSRTSRRARRRSSRPSDAGGLHAEDDVLGHGEHRDQHEVLVDHADPGVDRVLGGAGCLRLAVDQDLALIRLQQPVEDVHQRGLARPVLAEQAADLAWVNPEVDVVVGHEAAEALRDAAQLKFHARPSAGAPADCADRTPVPSRRRRACRRCDPGWAGRPRGPAQPGLRLHRALGGRLDLAADDLPP